MGRYLGRAIRGAGKVLEKGIESADALIDGPVTDGIKQVADTSKHTVNKVSKGITDRTSTERSTDNNIKAGDENIPMILDNPPDKQGDTDVTPLAASGVEQFIGQSVDRKKLDEMISRGVLMRNETLKGAIWGSIEASRVPLGGNRSKHMELDLATKAMGMDKRSGLIGLTNRRVIFYMPKMMNRYEFDAFAIKQVDSVQFTKGMRKGRVDISIVNNNRVIKGIDNEEGKIIVELIQQALEEIETKSSAPTVVTTTAQSPIDALKMKFVNGEITKEEYEEKKAILEG